MTSLPLPEQVLVSGSVRSELSAAVEQIVEETWQAECARRPSLFNGQIFAVEGWDGKNLTGRFTEYRLLLAQLRRPELYDDLRINSLGVTGVLAATDGIIWGRRGEESTQYPGVWELVPAGGVDAQTCSSAGVLDLRRQLLHELEEELGLKPALVQDVIPLCLVHDETAHHDAYAMEIQVGLSGDEIRAARSALPHPEHSEIVAVAPAELETFIARQPPPLAELTRLMLAHSRIAAL